MTHQIPPAQTQQSVHPRDYLNRVVVATPRDYSNLSHFHTVVCDYLKTFDAPVLFICGAECLMTRWCAKFGYPCLPFTPKWDEHPRSAIYVRNAEMNICATHVLVFQDNQSPEITQLLEIAQASMHCTRAAKAY